MKEYCVDLEIAKDLEKNGFPQKSWFRWDNMWYYPLKASEQIHKDKKIILFSCEDYRYSFNPYSAPTSDEILKELPNDIKDPNFDYFYHLKIEKSPIHDEMYLISYGITNQDRAWMEYYNKTDIKLSNSLAKMWLCLKKEGYIK